jgi:chromate reductase
MPVVAGKGSLKCDKINKTRHMNILTFSGSVRPNSSNLKLLETIAECFPAYDFTYFDIGTLPLFLPTADQAPWPESVVSFRAAVEQADGLIITTPEYLHNLPALVKNALEWLTTSGELMGKAVLPVTFTPFAPRGEKAMEALQWSLQALDARIVAQLPLYINELQAQEKRYKLGAEYQEMLQESLRLLH